MGPATKGFFGVLGITFVIFTVWVLVFNLAKWILYPTIIESLGGAQATAFFITVFLTVLFICFCIDQGDKD